jgi:hypothetical protein
MDPMSVNSLHLVDRHALAEILCVQEERVVAKEGTSLQIPRIHTGSIM